MSFISKFTKRDLIFSIVTGLLTGFSAWRIFEFLHLDIFGSLRVNIIFHILGLPNQNISSAWLILLVPILWILGVNLGYFLGRWFAFFNQFGKFAAIGFTNGAVDFGVLNLLIAGTGISSGPWYPVFKGISFVSAVIPSYAWNKYWAFRPAAEVVQAFGMQGPVPIGTNSTKDNVGGGGFEFAKFISVAVVSIFINDSVASLVVNYIHPALGMNAQQWANMGAVVGSAVALIFSFIGFRMAVFKK